MRQPSSIREVVQNGLCIGCGLCEAVSPGLTMRMTPEGRERPQGEATPAEEARILTACPGAVMAAEPDPEAEIDPIWRGVLDTAMAHSELLLPGVELPEELPEWSPEITVDPRWAEEEE